MSSNVGKKLDDWLLKQPPQAFPDAGQTDYAKQLDAAIAYLNKHVHPEVEKGAAVHDAHVRMFLNDHGLDHVTTVVSRASGILNAASCKVSPYEAYLFLFAAHLHDTGNLFGRDKHEQGCREIMKRLGTRAGDDEFEKRQITLIAAAHGGKTPEGDRDTISRLLPEPQIKLLNQSVRPQFLAALLRLADELADDRSRASRFALNAGAIPPESELYHHYSLSLHSVTIDEREVKLDFAMTEQIAAKLFPKSARDGTDEHVYLLDEIFQRTMKMHLERIYCVRFMRPWIRLDEIRVNIEVYDTAYTHLIERIQYRLYETGYPSSPNRGIHEICPELQHWSGQALKDKLTSSAGGS